jgi:hypothetical protein
MTNAKKILITTEKREVVVLHRIGNAVVHHKCDLCPTEQTMLTLDEAIDLTGISTLSLVQQLTLPGIHSYETSAGRLLICQESLQKFSNGVK